MDDWVWIVIAAVALLLLLVVILATVTRGRRRHRSKELRDRFGPEYDREVNRSGRDEAEEALRQRMRQHENLALREVSDEERDAALTSWQSVQTAFVESPVTAVRDAEHLVFEVLRERGYPLESIEDRAAAISVEEPDLAGPYREAHASLVHAETNGASDMTRLRNALLSYRTLLYRLVDAPEVSGRLTTQADTGNDAHPTQLTQASQGSAPDRRPTDDSFDDEDSRPRR